MKNFVHCGDMVTVPAPTGGVASGDGVLIGSLFGVAACAAAEAAPVEIKTEGVFDLDKAASAAFLVGAKVYWDAVNRAATATASGNAWIGVATAAAVLSDATARVRLNHTPS